MRLAGRGAGDLDPHAVGVEHEHLVVAGEVAVLLGREVDPRADVHAAPVRRVDLFAVVDVEGEVLDPDLVVAMLAAVGGPEADVLLAELKIDNVLAAAVGS